MSPTIIAAITYGREPAVSFEEISAKAPAIEQIDTRNDEKNIPKRRRFSVGSKKGCCISCAKVRPAIMMVTTIDEALVLGTTTLTITKTRRAST